MIDETKNIVGYGERELRDLWIALSIALSFTIYHLIGYLVQRESEISRIIYEVLSNGLMLWIFGLLWIAYRRWRASSRIAGELRNIMGSLSTEMITVIGPDRRINTCNDALQNLFGYRPEQIIGEMTDKLYGDRRKNKENPGEIREALEKEGVHTGHALGRKATGDTFPLEISTTLLKTGQGAVMVLRDITERERAEAAILKAKDEAEQAYKKLKEMEKLRDNLTHMIIHDMRAPLQILLVNQQLMVEQHAASLSPDARGMLQEMLDQTGRLAEMANTVLDVSRLESGQFPLKRQACDLATLIRETLGAVQTLTQHHRVSCDTDGAAGFAMCDPEIIRRIAINLLSNAVKFTPQNGEIKIGVKRSDHQFRVEVRDSGAGIAAENQGLIFEKFGQVGTQTKKKGHSAGLGLTFCKLAVESHGGKIGVESSLGAGATFWFTLPEATS